MKILVVNHEFPPIGGGGGNACYFLTKYYAEKGHDVLVVTANYGGMSPQETINGVRIIRLNSKRRYKDHCSFFEMLDFIFKAYPISASLLKNEKYDICHVFFGIPSGVIGYLLKKKFKIPYVIRFGGGDIPGFQDRFTAIYKLLAPVIRCIWKNADSLVMNSDGLAQLASEFCNDYPFNIICNGVDTNIFCPSVSKKGEYYNILFVSRLIERKGLQFFIPQLEHIKTKTNGGFQLTIVGDGPYRADLERLVEEYGMTRQVSFVGHKDRCDIIEYYQNADVFILPSLKEGMPNVVLEAMACGLPIIITPCQGSKELVCYNNGFICDLENFSDKIVELFENEPKRKQMGARSREVAVNYFSWEHTASTYLDLFERIVEK